MDTTTRQDAIRARTAVEHGRRPDAEPSYEDVAHTQPERLVQEIRKESAEGTPADLHTGPRGIGLWIAVVVALVALAAVGVAFWLGPLAALAVLFVGCAIVLMNPEVWASVLRGKERQRAKDRVLTNTTRAKDV